ncbi:MAG: hypothetical protein WD114_00945 [Phycisphaerales bacterium]
MTKLTSRHQRAVLEAPCTIRGFHHTDWSDYQHLMREGVSLKSCYLSDEDCHPRRRQDDINIESARIWPLGGMWLLESAGEVVCILRVMIFPTHAQVRRAGMSEAHHAPLLVELMRHVFKRCQAEGVSSIVIEEDVSPSQAEQIAASLGWGSMVLNDTITLYPGNAETTTPARKAANR